MKKLLLILFISIICVSTTGCLNLKSDSMEDITIYTTVYPTEYITSRLYGDNSKIHSIYPDGVIPSKYELTSKQIKDYSKADLFIFNGLADEKNYVSKFFKHNRNIMIIDSTSSMEIDYRTEELWLNPSNLLMIAQNIKNGLNEYITNKYLKDSIESNYNELKLELSNLDADLSVVANNAFDKNIIVTDDLFSFLSKYGFNVISLDSDTATEKTIATASKLIKDGTVKTVFAPSEEELNEAVKKIVETNSIEVSYLHTLSNITTDERKNKEDFLSIMKKNIELIKKELYK